MSTSSVSSTSSSDWVTASSSTVSNSTATSDLASFDSFIQILATQLQNQDPTDPVENTELVSQMAQLSSLSQLQVIGNSVNAYAAYSLIGQDVTYSTTDSSGNTATASGTVSSVKVSNGSVYLNINGVSVSYDSLVSVNGTPSSAST